MLAFGDNVGACQRRRSAVPTISAGVRWASSLDDLLREADVVVLWVPLTAETERLIGVRELGLTKQTALLINCSRGRVVNERALYDALASHPSNGNKEQGR